MRYDYSQCGRQGPEEIPLDWTRNLWNTTFLGVRAVQYWSDFLLWEQLFEATPLKGVIELGALYGGLTLFFFLEAIQRDLSFATFDIQKIAAQDTPLSHILGLRRCVHIGDLWGDCGDELREILRTWPHPLVLLCDNGSKPKEFQTFVPLLTAGDIVGVHDWGNEFGEGDIPDSMRPMIEPYFVAECDRMGSLTRFWRRV